MRLSERIVLATALATLSAVAGSAGQAAGPAAPPSRLLVCEATNDACTLPNARFANVWQFDGQAGSASTPNGPAGARLTVEQYDGKTIVVRRFDRSGPTAGLSGLYTGTVEGNKISGTVKWSWEGHPDMPPTGMWAAMVDNAPAADTTAGGLTGAWNGLPPLLIECEGTGPCNAAWHISGSEGTAEWFGQVPVRAKLAIVRSTEDDILIRRTDSSDGNFAVYSGARHGSQISGTVIWSTPGHPGQGSGTWSASIPETECSERANLTARDAFQIGQNALMFDRRQDALGCYVVAAKTGDPMAETAVGLLYYQGSDGVPQDYEQALYWLRKAADQGVYAAQKTVSDMFMLGQGTKRDAELSRFYADKAAEQKHDWERAQDLEDRRMEARTNALTGFVFGAVFGALFF